MTEEYGINDKTLNNPLQRILEDWFVSSPISTVSDIIGLNIL